MPFNLQEHPNSIRQQMKRLQKRYRGKLGRGEIEDIKLRAKLELLKELLR